MLDPPPLRFGLVAAAAALLVAVLLSMGATVAYAHGASFKDPSDSPKRSARPSPTAPAPPVTTAESADGVPPTWRPEGWYRWWELNAVAYLPMPRRGLTAPVTTPQAAPTESGPPSGAADRARLEAALLRLVDPDAKTEKRILAAALVTLGRVATSGRPVPILKRWATNRPAGFQVREAAMLGLALMRRDAAAARLSVVQMRKVRRLLMDRADDTQEPVRTRAFATLCLGLLADQDYDDTALERDGRATTRWLWRRLRGGAVSVEIDIARLTAIGMQPAAGVPEGVAEGLKVIATGGPMRGRAWRPFERSHAVTALARLGKANVETTLLRLIAQPREHPCVHAATAIALMRRATHMSGKDRLSAITTLRSVLGGSTPPTDWLARSLMQMGMGALLGAQLATGSDTILIETDADTWLRREALHGRRECRPFCALALGLAFRSQKADTHTFLPWRSQLAQTTLMEGLRRGGRSDRMLGAYAIALGISGADSANHLLFEQLKERERHGVLRGHSALALGLLGPRELGLTTALLAATRERAHVFLHLQAARALGLLDVEDALPKMKRRFDAAESPSVTAALALGLAELGDLRASGSLIGRIEDGEQAAGVRVSCIVAAGVLLDPEPGSSGARATVNANYPALSGALRRFLDWL